MPKSPAKNERIYLRINGELKRKVELIAAKKGMSLSELTTRFFNNLVEHEEKNEQFFSK